MKIKEKDLNLVKVRQAVNGVLQAVNGLTIDEAKLCLKLSESIVTGQSMVRTEPVVLTFQCRDGELDFVGWMLSEEAGDSEIDQ